MSNQLLSSINLGRGARLAVAPRSEIAPHHRRHRHFWPSGISRRQFLIGSSCAAAGILLAPGLWNKGGAYATPKGPGIPNPIPGGFEFDGVLFHNLAPGVFDPPDTDPSGVTDFDGLIAYAIIDGTGTHTNKSTGAQSIKPFEVDLRFMQGVFVGTDHRKHSGTFAEI